jgi:hypothetical protein
MVIEHAERFGLAALHQLRGRVGRGTDQAYCFLIYSSAPVTEGPDLPEFAEPLTEDGKTRSKVMLENNDGFIIAEEDLKLREPGQITGIEQSGYLSLNIADPVRNAAELTQARLDAFAILEKDPGFLGACCTCGYFCIFIQKYPDLRAPANLWFECSLHGIKIHKSEFLYDFALKRNKLLAPENRCIAEILERASPFTGVAL